MKQPEGYEAKGKGAPGMSAQEEHSWTQTVTLLLEYSYQFSLEEDGILPITK